MHTVFLTLVFIALIFWCGFGPVLLLLPAQPSARRVLLLPFAGLASHIIVALILAQFDLTGRTISLITLPTLSVLAILGLRRSPLQKVEILPAIVPLCLGAFSLTLIGLPLFLQGYQQYWGYANPDQAYLMPVMKWIYTHPIGIPPYFPSDPQYYRGMLENTVLAIFYITSTVSTITGTPTELLFNVTHAGLLFLSPLSVFLFAESLGLCRRTSIIISGCIACSSLVAYTFYLDSLAASSVIAITPAALALLLSAGREKSIGYGVLFGVVAASMYYNYLGAIGVLGALSFAILMRQVIYREVSFKRVMVAPAVALGLIAAVLTPFAFSIFRIFVFETFSSRLAGRSAAADMAEILRIFDLSFTDRGVPFFWGLKIPTVTGSWPWSQGFSFYLFCAGCACFILLILAFWPRVSGLSSAYVWIAVAALAPTLVYAYRGVGYGVFKLIAWIHPIMATGLIATLCGLAVLFRRTRWSRLCVLPYLVIAAYAAVNFGLTCHLGLDTRQEARVASQQSAVSLSFSDVSDVECLVTPQYAHKIVVMVPDVIAQRWLKAFLEPAGVRWLPELSLYTENSSPRLDRPALSESYVLYEISPSLEITNVPRAAAVWRNSAFELSRLSELPDAVFLGLGWYRVEGSASAKIASQRHFRWLRKRGEVFIWNPSATPKQLVLTMAAGFGNPSPFRHVKLYLNGQRFDEIVFSGYGRFRTKPFQPSGPWSQLEVEVEEDATPVPRPDSLWASSVPQDPRKLNVAVSEIQLVSGDPYAALPGTLDVGEEFKRPQAFFEGVYPDGWMGAEAQFLLRAPGDAREIEVSGDVPSGPGVRFPYPIDVALAGRTLGQVKITGPGAFRKVFPVGESGGLIGPGQTVRLQLTAESTFRPSNGDIRRLSVRLARVGFIQ